MDLDGGRRHAYTAWQTQNEGGLLGGAGLREMLQLEASGNREPETELVFSKVLFQRPACVLTPVESVPGTVVGGAH